MKQYYVQLLILGLALSASQGFSQSTDLKDSLALVNLFKSTDGEHWRQNQNWLTGPVSTWYGIQVTDGRVTSINLPGNNLTGHIPDSLGNLYLLTTLDLSWNSLSDTIPSSLGNLSALKELKLGENNLGGSLPASLGNLRNLERLDVSGNQLTGYLSNSFDSLNNLLGVDLSDNHYTFDGMENISVFNSAYTISYSPQAIIPINYNSNAKTLSVSAGGTLARNTYIWYKNGSIYKTVHGDSTLTTSENGVYHVRITGIGHHLTLYSNSYNQTTISDDPVNIQDSLALVHLFYSTNGSLWYNTDNWLKGTVSTWFGISVTSGRVTAINLITNGLSGKIPTSIGMLSKLRYLNLSNNSIQKNIPPSMGNLKNLQHLDLSWNHLSGPIPSSLGNLIQLEVLDISYVNDMTGSIPASLGNLNKLKILNLGGYLNLTGTIPASLGKLISLNSLDLHSNKLTGSIPASFGNLVNLTGLYLGGNLLTGSIPASLGNLTNLDTLSLAGNQLSNTIPASLGNLSSLTVLDLGPNLLTGPIPASLGNLTNLREVRLYYNQLTGTVPGSFGNLTNLQYLMLQNNKLTGTIPGSFGNLTNLQFLELENNKLTGTIPGSFGNLTNLSGLTLENNELSGKIPLSLSTLSNLWMLKLENNKFTFDGLEKLVDSLYFPPSYAPQKNIPINYNANTRTLSVSAGGTLENNTYKWYKNGVRYKTRKGDSTLVIAEGGSYSVRVKNAVATDLTLISDSILVETLSANIKNGSLSYSNITTVHIPAGTTGIYPNPANSILYIQLEEEREIKSVLMVSDISGKIIMQKEMVLTKGRNIITLNVSSLPAGNYVLIVKSSGITKKEFIKQ